MRATPVGDGRTPARTLLESKIRERNMTLEEFAEYAETFARENNETGTISARHLQRLLTPRSGGAPPNPRPATRRLLEHIFGRPLAELLAPPKSAGAAPAGVDEFAELEADAALLGRQISTANRVDDETVRLLAAQIDTTRRLDRRFGAATLLGALRLHAQHIESLFAHCTGGATYRALAAVLTDAHTLAGWQSLDRGEITAAWNHYRQACDAARAAESDALLAHALAEQAVVLADINRTSESVAMSAHARAIGRHKAPLLQAWLAAAYGEAYAADGQQDTSLRAFDDAARRLPDNHEQAEDGPYLALDRAHLARWRGHALACFGHRDAIFVLTAALAEHDAEFSRAEAGLRADLVRAHLAARTEGALHDELKTALALAHAVGSTRQRRRLRSLVADVAS